ncbi:acyltransferase family protein [Vibrio ostreicida]|uniref:Acyltransferase family protein n=1 Tax=Vibrio ostreicida TaxID=526588 RepID=A0ABT8BQU6_9VIBR|nr:acyltransferase family protein [Vibrio ostreicida]MDN3608485.1 acyltransferase family protein [Vibrio ostreicida]NPD10307.1 acyltransferase family protein [Vibrio ostreicida]
MRIEKIDIVKGIGMLCIILSHCFISGTLLHKWLYSFHIPLFFFVSGLFYKQRSIKELTKTRFNTLIKPYFFFSLASLGLLILFSFISSSIVLSQQDLIDKSIGLFYANGYGEWMFNITLWFLPCLFVLESLYNAINRVALEKYVHIIVVVAVLLGYLVSKYSALKLPVSIDIAFVALGFYHFGCVAKDFILKSNSLGVVTFLITFTLSWYLISYSELVNMSHREYGELLELYIQGVIGTIMIISLSNIIAKSSLLSYIGRNSLVILGTHTVIISLFMGILPKIGISYSSDIEKSIQAFLLCTFTLPIVIFVLNNKFGYFLGKKEVNRGKCVEWK